MLALVPASLVKTRLNFAGHEMAVGVIVFPNGII